MKYAFLILPLFLLTFNLANAQMGFGGNLVNQELTIDTEPINPEPLSPVKALINDYSLPVTVTGIEWKLNGQALPEADNLRSINFSNSESQTESIIEATISLAGGGSLKAVKVLRPTYLDIIIEPLTRTPAFYQGRAAPSNGSRVNLTALVDGYNFPSDLIYTWRLNNKVLEGGHLRGQNKITITTPAGQKFILGVEVSDLQGRTIAQRTMEIPTVTPEVYFYENSTLLGLSPLAITNTFNLISESSTIQAEPYYLDLSTYNNPPLLEWTVGGQKNNVLSTNPYQITLSRLGSGTAPVGFEVRNLSKLLQGARANFTVNF